MDPVIHFEMPYDDAARASRFYQQAFGWETQQMGAEMGNYVVLTTGKEDSRPDAPRGVIGGGLFGRSADMPAQYPSVVIAVKEVRAAMKRIQDAGGEVLGEPMQIPGIGLYLSFFDTERNRVSILQPDKMG